MHADAARTAANALDSAMRELAPEERDHVAGGGLWSGTTIERLGVSAETVWYALVTSKY